MIGEAEIRDGLHEQTEMFKRVADRTPDDPEGVVALREYADNMAVDFDALDAMCQLYVAHNPYARVLPSAAAVRWFLLGVVLGRDHRP